MQRKRKESTMMEENKEGQAEMEEEENKKAIDTW